MRVSVRDIFHRGDPIAATPSAEAPLDETGMACIACGGRLPQVLEKLGSLRCHDWGRAGIEPATLGLKIPCSTN
jgi:hypothetical protein